MIEPIRWWGDFPFEIGERRRWRIGPLDLRVTRLAVEWLIAWERGPDSSVKSLEVGVPDEGEVPGTFEVRRLAGATEDGPLQVGVRLPDRPFVCRPQIPFSIVPGGEVTIYVSTPIVVTLAQRRPITEILSFRPSDTWLGATPRSGQLAYFTRTHAATSLDGWVPNRSRAVTALHLRNATSQAVEMTRISLPVPQLRVFADPLGVLSTESLNVEFRTSVSGVSADVALAPVLGDGVPLCQPRVLPDRLLLSRALRALFE